ncbi:hypothetical protein A9306_04800 [Moraxella atlantae]|uniref:Uncharacterized protein n=1 Tax=Faucicola atlantae TaxID=34059 RepID=A0A1B8QJZ5_9GAMM|nr:hypothetical protein A9306_04800 [Moraxella atlantae]
MCRPVALEQKLLYNSNKLAYNSCSARWRLFCKLPYYRYNPWQRDGAQVGRKQWRINIMTW